MVCKTSRILNFGLSRAEPPGGNGEFEQWLKEAELSLDEFKTLTPAQKAPLVAAYKAYKNNQQQQAPQPGKLNCVFHWCTFSWHAYNTTSSPSVLGGLFVLSFLISSLCCLFCCWLLPVCFFVLAWLC
jgi:hypothetical protein